MGSFLKDYFFAKSNKSFVDLSALLSAGISSSYVLQRIFNSSPMSASSSPSNGLSFNIRLHPSLSDFEWRFDDDDATPSATTSSTRRAARAPGDALGGARARIDAAGRAHAQRTGRAAGCTRARRPRRRCSSRTRCSSRASRPRRATRSPRAPGSTRRARRSRARR